MSNPFKAHGTYRCWLSGCGCYRCTDAWVQKRIRQAEHALEVHEAEAERARQLLRELSHD